MVQTRNTISFVQDNTPNQQSSHKIHTMNIQGIEEERIRQNDSPLMMKKILSMPCEPNSTVGNKQISIETGEQSIE